MAKRGGRRLAMRAQPLLVIMVKAPVCGAVKTRLAKEIGAVQAASLYRTLTARLLREVAPDPRFETLLAISPDHALNAPFTPWKARCGLAPRGTEGSSPPHPNPLPKGRGSVPSPLGEKDRMRGDFRQKFLPRRIKQGGGDVGRRMRRIFHTQGRGPTIIIGSDIPFITREIIANAFRRLVSAHAVIGPAEDGGYWLLGFRRRPSGISPFANVQWSTQHVLADTLGNLASYRVAFAETLFDIDTAADFRRYLRERYR